MPTAHLKLQWAHAASEFELHLDTGWSPSRGAVPRDMHGVVTTYQQIASAPTQFRRLADDAIVILDEIHHAGDDRAWGQALLTACSSARRRLSLSGTPFRSDTRSIPFVNYRDLEAQPDFEYGYGPALAEHRVVRPVYFPRTNGDMEWSAPDGSLHAASFDDPLSVARATSVFVPRCPRKASGSPRSCMLPTNDSNIFATCNQMQAVWSLRVIKSTLTTSPI